ncbi:hypothetical protein Patl1_31313 [Pistacia atlantica]|uniref:Uncharacterized protein n=1 Tax=Pistacia atlantica TaxID=434234 RepID=A0ACC1AA45_9ROSI|nr:hypothetical protein Patl1_31313 [Pistacia atlantica]
MAHGNNRISTFERLYRCYPVSFIDKPHLEKGDKIVMPPSALDRLVFLNVNVNVYLFSSASLHIEYPMLFELSNTSAGRITHCGVLEFIADEGLIYLPYWMMENMLLEEGDIVKVKNTSLVKGSYVRLQPHTKDFLDISNPKAILETSLRSYSCLTTGDTIMVPYNNKKYYIDIVETKPSSAVSIIETDCEVDFAPPLDYKEPEKLTSSLSNRTRPEDDHNPNLSVEEEPAKKIAKFSPFTGSGKRLDGKSSTQPGAQAPSFLHKPRQPKDDSETNGSKSSASSRQHSGKLVFGSNASQTLNETPKVAPKSGSQESPEKMEKGKFQAFTGKKYSLKG